MREPIIGTARLILAGCAAFALLGCAKTPAPTAEPISLAAPGGVGPDPAAEPPPTSEPIQVQAPPAAATPEPTANQVESTPAPVRRTDGRPTWWLDEPVRERGMVLITAEALAPDLRSARRAAVDAGLARLREAIGAEPASWEIRLSTISPLRAVRAPGEVNRFAGYVLIAGTP